MEKRYDKGQIETVVLQAVLARRIRNSAAAGYIRFMPRGKRPSSKILRAAVR